MADDEVDHGYGEERAMRDAESDEEQDPTEAELSSDCRTTYAMLDEVEEQLNEAVYETTHSDHFSAKEIAAIEELIKDLKSCKRVRKLVGELLDPQYVPAQAADSDPDGS